jgi:hypothetical protein
MRAWVVVCLALGLALAESPARAQEAEILRRELEQLKQQLQMMQEQYQKTIQEMTDRLQRLEAQPAATPPAPAAAAPAPAAPALLRPFQPWSWLVHGSPSRSTSDGGLASCSSTWA